MNETMITLNGIVVTDLKQAEVRGNTVASFRLLSAVRRYERLRGWHDAELNFVTVTCWRGLALNVISSVKKGDPLIVFGRLKVRSWDAADRGGSTVEIDAYALGHDLNRGTSAFKRNKELEAAEKDDTVEETARRVRSDAEEEGVQAERAILEARRTGVVDTAAIVAGGGGVGSAATVAPNADAADKPDEATANDSEQAAPGMPERAGEGAEVSEVGRNGKKAMFGLGRPKEPDRAGV